MTLRHSLFVGLSTLALVAAGRASAIIADPAVTLTDETENEVVDAVDATGGETIDDMVTVGDAVYVEEEGVVEDGPVGPVFSTVGPDLHICDGCEAGVTLTGMVDGVVHAEREDRLSPFAAQPVNSDNMCNYAPFQDLAICVSWRVAN